MPTCPSPPSGPPTVASVRAELPVVRFEARDRGFEVHCDESAHDAVASMLASLASRDEGGPSSASFTLTRREGRWTVLVDGCLMMSSDLLADAVDGLMVAVNQRVASVRDDVLSVHAAGVAVDGLGLVLPAPSASGKTTLCARLVERGAAYLSDESVGLTRDGLLLGYAKPFGFKRGTFESFADLDLGDVDLGAGPQAVWQVPPARLGAVTVASSSPRLVVRPRFSLGSPVRMEALSPHAAAAELLSQAQNLRSFGVHEALDVIGATVARCDRYQLTFADGREAADAVLEVARHTGEAAVAPYRVVRPALGFAAGPARPAPGSDVAALCFEDGAVLVRAASGETATTDAVGALVWPLLDGTRTVAMIAEELSDRFTTPPDVIEADVAPWVAQLVENGFLVGTPAA